MDASTILRAGFDALHVSGVTTLFRKQFQGIGAIFCLHHVVPDGGRKRVYAPNYQLEISPEFLQVTINACLARGYELVSMAEAVNRLKQADTSRPPFAVFTLDDGYNDNAIHAAPVFRRNRCPYTIFVAPRIADGTCELWWRALEIIIGKTNRLGVSIGDQVLDLETLSEQQKAAAWRMIANYLKAMPEYDQRAWIRSFAAAEGHDLAAYCRSVAMTWDEIAELNRDPLCTIGAHTLNHYAVARLPTEDVLRELIQSKSQIEARLGESCEFFAYPYGDEIAAGPRDFSLAAQAGFTASVTTRKGVVFPEFASHLQAIPRVMLSGRYQQARYVDALLSGVPFALLNRFRKVNVS
jgi:peptidoglycan/xylan/chitin deacetylase (PgdA/CDA1 family)